MKKTTLLLVIFNLVSSLVIAQEFLIKQEQILPKVCVPEVTPVGIKFIYFNPDATKVTLVGDFTDWANKQLLMQKDEKGFFTRIVNLKEGNYEYKYIIDGEWLPGENIKLKIYKDPQTGELKVEQKEVVQEKYSQKIFFFGKVDLVSKFASETTSYFDHYISLDFKLKISDNMEGFVRTDLKGGLAENEFRLRFFSGFYDVHFGNGLLSLFHNYPKFQFLNPSRIFNLKLPLIYDSVDFVYEKNEIKNFGKDCSGVYFTQQFLNTILDSAIVYNKDDYSTTVAVRYDTYKLVYPLRAGVTTSFVRGKRWLYSYYTNIEWFPNPEKEFNRDNQPWYKAFVEKNFLSFDTGFNMFPTTLLFCELYKKDSKLQSYRWNEGIGVDSPSSKYWKLYDTNGLMCGLQQKISDKIKLETGYDQVKTNYYSLLTSGVNSQSMSQNSGYIKFVVNLLENKLTLGQETKVSNYNYSDKFSIVKDRISYYDVNPWYLQEYKYDVYTTSPVSSQQYSFPEQDLKFNLYLTFSSLPDVYSKIVFTYYDAKKDKITNDDINYFETTAEVYYRIYKKLYLQLVPRYVSYKENFITYFAGVNFVFPSAGVLSVGTGYPWPYMQNEDINLYVDARNEKLYNLFQNTKHVLTAEKNFKEKEFYPLLVRFQLRF